MTWAGRGRVTRQASASKPSACSPRGEDEDVVEPRVDGDALQVGQHRVAAPALPVGSVDRQAPDLGAVVEPCVSSSFVTAVSESVGGGKASQPAMARPRHLLAQLPAGDREPVPREDVVLGDVVLQLLA